MNPNMTLDQTMKLKYIPIILIFLLSICSTNGHAQQKKPGALLYPACEPRATTDPGRLNIRASAKNYGTISPCTGRIDIYINKNSKVRSLEFDVVFLNRDNEALAEQRLRVKLEGFQTGMFSKEISLEKIETQTCRSIQISIQSMTCFSTDGSNIDCPEIRLIPPDDFHSLIIYDESLNVCSNGIQDNKH